MRTMLMLLLTVALVASVDAQAVKSSANEALARELETYLSDLSAKGNPFSGALLVSQGSRPIFNKAYGLADSSTNQPNTVETKFNVGSMNKMFTAVAIAQLAQRGKLSFDDTISRHLPDYPNAAAAKITIHQLLTHISGLGNYQNEKFRARLDRIRTVSDLLPFFVNDPLEFEPGAKWQYSNSGYVVLGLIIEKVSGQSYYDYVRENIFKVAGMTNTDSYDKGAKVSNLAIGYTRMGSDGQTNAAAELKDNTSTRPWKGSPAGGGYSTVADLMKFVVALQGHKLLNKEYTAIVTTGKIEVGGPMGKYAYGFGDKIFAGKHIIGHNGGAPGIASNLDIFPELGYTAIILANQDPRSVMPIIMKIRQLIPNPGVPAGEPKTSPP